MVVTTTTELWNEKAERRKKPDPFNLDEMRSLSAQEKKSIIEQKLDTWNKLLRKAEVEKDATALTKEQRRAMADQLLKKWSEWAEKALAIKCEGSVRPRQQRGTPQPRQTVYTVNQETRSDKPTY